MGLPGRAFDFLRIDPLSNLPTAVVSSELLWQDSFVSDHSVGLARAVDFIIMAQFGCLLLIIAHLSPTPLDTHGAVRPTSGVYEHIDWPLWDRV